MSGYTVFIEGDIIDLCVPSRLAIEKDRWADWFNDAKTTQFLGQGIFPNFIEDQHDFYESLRRKKRIALLIKPKESDSVYGIVALSFINWQARNAQITIVLGRRDETTKGRLFALEAWARMTAHGFDILGMDRIYANQAYPGLKKFNKKLELLGFRTEGIIRNGFVKGRTVTDSVIISCMHDNYREIKELRGGQYWMGEERMKTLISQQPQKAFVERIDDVMREETEKYFSDLKLL